MLQNSSSDNVGSMNNFNLYQSKTYLIEIANKINLYRYCTDIAVLPN